MFTKILVAIDGSPASKKALSVAVDMAKSFAAELHSLAVEGHLPAYAATIGEVEEAKAEKNHFFQRIQEEARAVAAEQEIDIGTITLAGDPAETIVRYAEEHGFDLLILAHKGHSRTRRFLLGSTSDKVVDHAPCTVMVVK